MQREKGWRAPKSGVGFPHGKDKKRERAKRVAAQLAEKAKAATPPPAPTLDKQARGSKKTA